MIYLVEDCGLMYILIKAEEPNMTIVKIVNFIEQFLSIF